MIALKIIVDAQVFIIGSVGPKNVLGMKVSGCVRENVIKLYPV